MKVELKQAIKETEKYALKYGQKLNDQQIFERLISPKIFSKKEVINQLKNSSRKIKEDVYCWQEKMKKAEELTFSHLSKMKGILMVGVTGNVAAEWAIKKSDIDLLIVTRADELWWQRLYLRFYIWWHKIPHRKFRQREKKDEFCFNLWLDEKQLRIPKHKQNLKNATDLIMMKVILNKEKTYEKFLRGNDWVKKFLATGYDYKKRKNKQEVFMRNKKSSLRVRISNWCLFVCQYTYMCLKSQRIIKEVGLKQAFFHNEI